MTMKSDFIEFLLQHQALKFGNFTLKSGRQSPFFFNLGVFSSGSSLTKLGEFYAQTLLQSQLEYEVLFGPAYKGISLATATSIALYQQNQLDVPFAFNRKEAKDHGDGGLIVGRSLQNKKVIMLDDVITAGTTVRETIRLLKEFSASFSGIIIAFDRQERGEGKLTATQEVQEQYGIPVASILKLNDVIEYLESQQKFKAELAAIKAYQEQFGLKN